ncbi:hypothetical protein PMAYCL1PPCAC_32077 [Pristionchus mayeri]|uniref:BTB domain-containing protein n=1 Tax=Pristionchus mayeri TaxID=1317129 RepID=A0AAN5DH16_9BILA|nr:hypothetical protein PMAYCL1PPCAC_32077 [Pristionchus mayeri]
MTQCFTIIVGDRKFQVDAEKYAGESEFMRALMGGSFIESSKGSVTLHDVSVEDWTGFHDYIEGAEELGTHNAEAIYYIADRFGFERVRAEVESRILLELKLRQQPDWDEFAFRMLHLINRIKDKRSRLFREKLISMLERSRINVGRSIQEGRVTYRHY